MMTIIVQQIPDLDPATALTGSEEFPARQGADDKRVSVDQVVTKVLTNPSITGNTATDGTIDGRDVAADGAALDDILGGGSNLTVNDLTVTGEVIENLPMAAGKGIDFSGIGTAAEILDDYEEGIWTPTVYGATIAGTTVYGSQVGTFTKVGRLVTCTIFLSLTSKDGVGSLYIGGLPFTSAGASARGGGGVNFFSITTANKQTKFHIASSVSYAYIYLRDITSGSIALCDMSDATNNFQAYGSFSYIV